MMTRGPAVNPAEAVIDSDAWLSENWDLLTERAAKLGSLSLLPVDLKEDETYKALGCGYFGCVYRTAEPGVVFKLTGDQSEAKAFNVFLQQMETMDRPYPPGLADCMGVFELPTTGESMTRCRNEERLPMYALWREDLQGVGMTLAPLREFMGLNGPSALSLQAQFASLHFTAKDALAYACRGEWDQISNEWENIGLFVRNFTGRMESKEARIAMQDFRENEMFLANEVALLYIEMAKVEKSDPVATPILNFYRDTLSRGIIVGDAHSDNIGLTRGFPPQLAVTDPGLSFFVTPEVRDLEVPFITEE